MGERLGGQRRHRAHGQHARDRRGPGGPHHHLRTALRAHFNPAVTLAFALRRRDRLAARRRLRRGPACRRRAGVWLHTRCSPSRSGRSPPSFGWPGAGPLGVRRDLRLIGVILGSLRFRPAATAVDGGTLHHSGLLVHRVDFVSQTRRSRSREACPTRSPGSRPPQRRPSSWRRSSHAGCGLLFTWLFRTKDAARVR